jgi:hypothetical protein
VKLNEKFIDLWLNMDDRKVVMIKAQDDMVLIELDIRAIKQRMKPLKEKVSFSPTN